MAYIDQATKATIAAALKVAMVKYPTCKYTLSIRNHMTLVCKIKSGPAFLIPADGYRDVNVYHIDSQNTPEAAELLNTILTAMKLGNHDNSDVQSDYFDVGWYNNIQIGTYDKHYTTN